MNPFLVAAGVLSFLLAPLHSFLGERLIFKQLMRQEFPPIAGSEVLTKRTLRFFWHLIDLLWWGFAVLLWRFAALPSLDPSARFTVSVIAWIFLASSVYAFVATRGRHFAWALFLVVAIVVWLGLR